MFGTKAEILLIDVPQALDHVAAESSTSDKANSAVTRPRRVDDCEGETKPRPDSRRASFASARAACSAGSAPNSKAVSNVAPIENQSTGALIGIASIFGMLTLATALGKIANRNCADKLAKPMPNNPPIREISRLSHRNC